MTFFRFGPSPLSVKSTVLAFALVAPVTSACAQSTSPPQGSNPPAATNEEPSLQRRPLDIENSQPDPHEQYLLGPGDDITVTVSGRPELSGAQIVGPDGRITLPVAGSVEVGDKSRDDAAKAIDQALSNYYSGAISSTVQVTKYGSNHILLLGAVEHPGVITFDDPPTLLEAITKGGAVINADRTTQTARKCIIYRGKDEVMNVNLSDKFDSQKALLDIRLRRNDIVYVPENQESLISVLGEVGKPGPVRLNQNSTVITLLAAAGGITEKAGDPTIEIITPSTKRIQRVKYKDLVSTQAGTDISLHDGDTIFVPRSGLAKTGFFFQQISPIVGIGTIFTLTH